MKQEYDRDTMVGVLGNKPIPKVALKDEKTLPLDIALFLLFIHDVNSGAVG